MAHQRSSGGSPSGRPDDGVNAFKRSVPVSSEKENPQPVRPAISRSALDFTVSPTGGSAAESAHAPPPVAAQNSTQSHPPVNGPVPWLSEAARIQASISVAAPEVSPPAGHE